jgi:hypothetical protein
VRSAQPDHGAPGPRHPLSRVACARVGSGAALRVPAVASLEGQLGIPVMWVTWWLPPSRTPPAADPRKEASPLLYTHQCLGNVASLALRYHHRRIWHRARLVSKIF